MDVPRIIGIDLARNPDRTAVKEPRDISFQVILEEEMANEKKSVQRVQVLPSEK